MLDRFQAAEAGDERMQKVLERYSKLIHAKREKEKLKRLIRDEIVSTAPLLLHTSDPDLLS